MSGALTFTKAVPFRPQITPGGGPTLADAVEHAATSFMTWRDHERAASTAAGLLDAETGWPTRKGWMAAGMAYAQGLGTSNVGAIRAFHGSPHSFEAFDLGKVGTGEGAQAYGHGIYMAGNENVAQGYRRKLSFDQEGVANSILLDGKLVKVGTPSNELTPVERAALRVHYSQGVPERAQGYTQDLLDVAPPGSAVAKQEQSTLDALKSNDWTGRIKPFEGHTYEANLHADPEHLLDWDKPLSQQSSKVREFFETPAIGIGSETTGAEAYRMLGRGQEPDLSAAMHRSGIPGIRYLDGGSRNTASLTITPPGQTVSGKWMVKSDDYNSKGMHFDTEAEAKVALAAEQAKGTHNYVMFDPANIEIIRKYGVPALIGGAAAAGLAAPAAAAPDLTFTRAVPTFTKVDNAATAVGGSGAGGGTDGAAVQPVAPPAGVPAALSLPG